MDETLDPRVVRTRTAVLDAVRRLVRESGFEAVTHQRVSKEAGVGRASVYRHFPDRADLLVGALIDAAPEPDPAPPSGRLVDDVIRELQRLRRILNDSPFVPQLLTLLGRAEWDPPLLDLKRNLVFRGTAGVRRVLEDGIARGELDPSTDIDDTIARLAGPLFFRRLLTDRTIDDRFVGLVVADIIPAGTRHDIEKERQ